MKFTAIVCLMVVSLKYNSGHSVTNGDNVDKDTPGQYNAAENDEILKVFKETKIPLEDIEQGILPKDDAHEELKNLDDNDILQKEIEEIEDAEDKEADEDYINERKKDAALKDARPIFLCRRRRFWGSCAVRRRSVRSALKAIFRTAARSGKKAFSRRRRHSRRRRLFSRRRFFK